jgi:outer membrane lipoprotein LolB
MTRPFANRLNSAITKLLPAPGCGTLSKPTVSLNSTVHQLSLKQQESWLIKGKIGFRNSEKNQSANFRWQQNQQQYQLNLTSIIGTSLLNLKGDKKGVILTTDDEIYQDSDPSYLIWRVTGWQIPVEKLRLWIKGQHQKNDKVLISSQGWINQLQPMCNKCKNWLINYDNYKLVDGIWLPHKVLLQNNNNQLIIRVNKWELHE